TCDSACLPPILDHDFGPTGIPRATLAWITVRAQPKAEYLISQGIFTQERHTRRPQRTRTYAHSLRKTGLAVERARYEAERVRRQFDAVEPENRLVARSLESDWEA